MKRLKKNLFKRRITLRAQRAITCLALGVFISLMTYKAHGTNYVSLDEALKNASPGHELLREPYYFSKSQVDSINEALKKVGVDRKFKDEFFVRYSYSKDNNIVAYSYTDTARQRSKSQSVLITMNPKGKIIKITLLRNLEPAKYHPKDNWLAQFKEKSKFKEIKLNSSIVAITGATMTSVATVKSVKRVLVIHNYLNSISSSKKALSASAQVLSQ